MINSFKSILFFSLLAGFLLVVTTNANAGALTATEKPLAPLPKDIRPVQIIVSPDQSRFAWILKDEDSITVVVDGQKYKPCDWIVQDKIAFTADSQHLVYAARKRRKAVMVIDGNEGELADSISHWIISSAGQHIAYAATSNGRTYVIADNVPSAPFQFVQLHALGANGTLAYSAAKANKRVAIINGNESRPYDSVSDIRLSPDGRRFAYIASSNGQTRMIIDDQAGPPLDTLTPAQFSADGKHIAYLATRGNDSLCVLDGAAKTYTGKLSNLVLSADGLRHLFISTKDARDTLVIDGNPGPTHPAINTARFSADARHIAYIVQTPTGQSAFIDEQPIAHFDQILGLYPALAGQSFAFVALREGKSLILLDRLETPQYDLILGHQAPLFLGDGSIRFLALKDKQIVQVTCKPQE